MKTKKNELIEITPKDLIKFYPVGYSLMESKKIIAGKVKGLRKNGSSNFYQTTQIVCYRYHKPISKLFNI